MSATAAALMAHRRREQVGWYFYTLSYVAGVFGTSARWSVVW